MKLVFILFVKITEAQVRGYCMSIYWYKSTCVYCWLGCPRYTHQTSRSTWREWRGELSSLGCHEIPFKWSTLQASKMGLYFKKIVVRRHCGWTTFFNWFITPQNLNYPWEILTNFIDLLAQVECIIFISVMCFSFWSVIITNEIYLSGFMEAPSLSYVGEVTQPSLRARMCSLTSLNVPVGYLVMYLLGTVMDWRSAAACSTAFPILTALAISQVLHKHWFLSEPEINAKSWPDVNLSSLRSWSRTKLMEWNPKRQVTLCPLKHVSASYEYQHLLSVSSLCSHLFVDSNIWLLSSIQRNSLIKPFEWSFQFCVFQMCQGALVWKS